MGDVSAEPSMEDILASIKRIIAEDADNGAPIRARRRATPPPVDNFVEDDVLELSEEAPAPQPAAAEAVATEPAAAPAPTPMSPPVAAASNARAARSRRSARVMWCGSLRGKGIGTAPAPPPP